MLRFILAAAVAATLPLALNIGTVAAGNMPMLTDASTLTWAPAAGLPPGAQVAVLYGDPSKAGPFALRFKFPKGYVIPTHSHPTDELITVLSGKARMAFGEDAGEMTAQPMSQESFMVLPADAWHELWIDDETIVELHSTGPFATRLLHPAQ
jgi:hypothetical protein